jgi:hypothetical protein
MDGTLNQYIIYNSEYQVLICREHQCGITPSYIGRHFRNDHKNVPLTVCQNTVSGITALEVCVPENVTEVTETILPIPGLEIVNGYRCMAMGCGFLGGTLGSIKRHCREHTGEIFEDIGTQYIETKLQTFFKGVLLK